MRTILSNMAVTMAVGIVLLLVLLVPALKLLLLALRSIFWLIEAAVALLGGTPWPCWGECVTLLL